jgi:heterodisulfide reductase subunit B
MLAETNHAIHHDESLKTWVNRHLKTADLEIIRPVTVKHFSRILYEEVGIQRIQETITAPLTGFAFAPHYGCHYLKPSHVHDHFDAVESPESLDKLIRVTGADVIDLDGQKACCGGGVLAVNPELTYKMAAKKLAHITGKSADGLVLICPFCAVVYDDNQRVIEKATDQTYTVPVIYYPQLLGLAMGYSEKELGLKLNKVKTAPLVQRIKEAHHGE